MYSHANMAHWMHVSTHRCLVRGTATPARGNGIQILFAREALAALQLLVRAPRPVTPRYPSTSAHQCGRRRKVACGSTICEKTRY